MRRYASMWFLVAMAITGFVGAAMAQRPPEEASVLLFRAMTFPPEALAVSYLSVTHDLKLAQRALAGASVTLPMRVAGGDPQSVVIDKGNAETYVAMFEDRRNIYSHAIQQRGFQQLAQAYDIAVSGGCNKLGFLPGTAVIEQDEFAFRLATGRFQGAMRHRGAIVESALAIEHARQPGIYFVGQIQQGRIDLKPAQFGPQPAQLNCVVTLTAR